MWPCGEECELDFRESIDPRADKMTEELAFWMIPGFALPFLYSSK